MTFKLFVTNRVRAVWLKHDLALVQDENFPFQMRVAVHVVKQLALLDSVAEKGSGSRSETLKKIASDEKYYLSVAASTTSSAVYGSRLVLHWIGAFSVLQSDPAFYELVDASLWDFINSVLTPSQVAELMGIADPDPPGR